MDYKFLFLVGSAVEHFKSNDFSYFTAEQRFEQTLETIRSVKEKVPDAYICVYEVSPIKISEKYRERFIEESDLFLEFYGEPGIQLLYDNLNKQPDRFVYGKSMLECRALLNVFEYMKTHNIFSDVTRVFKISGRYTLNNYFNIEDYKTSFLQNYYVAKLYSYDSKRFEDTENIYLDLYAAKGMVVTGLWSFDRFLFGDVVDALEKSFGYMERAIQYTAGIDIEHSLYHFLDRNKILNIPTLGLDVLKGMDGDSYSL
jgi:hypothetical protein